jgi:DnaJ-class molecular chaperone
MGDEHYYATLGLSPNASRAAIRAAYRRLARACHPDLHPHNPQAAARFRQLHQAATVLSDPAQRAAYDQMAGFAAPAESRLTIAQWETFGYEATTDLALTPAEAAAGVTKELPFSFADGRPYRLQVHVPPGAVSGQRLRVPGAGGPARNGARRGDLIVIVRVVAPQPAEAPTGLAPALHRSVGAAVVALTIILLGLIGLLGLLLHRLAPAG